MRKFKYILVLLALATSATSFAGKDVGNGQLLVRVKKQWVPVEAALSNHARVFRGIKSLPNGSPHNGIPSHLNKPYGKYLEQWLARAKKLSPGQAMAFERVGQMLDFVFVDSELALTTEEYPKLPIKYKKFLKAAVYKGNTVYVSIPIMEKIGELNGLSPQIHQGFVLLHELINAEYLRDGAPIKIEDTMTRLRIGQLFLESRKKNRSKIEFMANMEVEKTGLALFYPEIPFSTNLLVLRYLKANGLLSRTQYSFDITNYYSGFIKQHYDDLIYTCYADFKLGILDWLEELSQLVLNEKSIYDFLQKQNFNKGLCSLIIYDALRATKSSEDFVKLEEFYVTESVITSMDEQELYPFKTRNFQALWEALHAAGYNSDLRLAWTYVEKSNGRPYCELKVCNKMRTTFRANCEAQFRDQCRAN